MSRITQTICDAPNCTTIKQETNHWFVRRNSDPNVFIVQMMSTAQELTNDQHICGSKCLHGELEQWIQSHTDIAALHVCEKE